MTPLLSSQEAAQRLGISPRRVLALIHAGRLPAVKVGRDWLIDPAVLSALPTRRPGRPKGGAEKVQDRKA
jgi:excisionase family DNA binding protein